MGKCYESVLKERLLDDAMKQKIDTLQFAYLSQRSCEDALLYVMHQIYQGCEDGGIVRCTLLDYSSAFNLVNHSMLRNKLEALDTQQYLIDIINSFL